MPKTSSKSSTKPSVPSPDGAAERGQTIFSFDRFIVRKAIFEELPRAAVEEGEAQPERLSGRLRLTLNVEIDKNQPRGLVTLGAILTPDLKWQPYRIEVAVAGVFRADRMDPGLFDTFCKLAVPSILFPYARQVIHNLTVDAAFGVLRVNPINLQALLATSWKHEEREETGQQ